jgi:hypothetical protein
MGFGRQISLKQLLTRNSELVKTVNVFMLASLISSIEVTIETVETNIELVLAC